MRAFATVYAAAALLAGIMRPDQPLPWLVMCGAAALLAFASATGRHTVMLCAAHAGLTATWAGTIASRLFKGANLMTSIDSTVFLMLMGLCAGMVVFISAGLRAQAQQPVPVPVRSRRR